MKKLILLLLFIPIVSFGQESSEDYNDFNEEANQALIDKYNNPNYDVTNNEDLIFFLLCTIGVGFFILFVFRPTPSEISSSVSKKIKSNTYREAIRLFDIEMKQTPNWYKIIEARGNGHEMAKSMGIKVDDYEYWANAHKEEYMLKYNDGNLDVEGINLRIEKFGFIVAELEKVQNKTFYEIDYPPSIDYIRFKRISNLYHAARASVLGAEYALKEMTK